MKKHTLVLVAAVLVAGWSVARAQTPAGTPPAVSAVKPDPPKAPPALTTEQKQAVTILLQRIENDQLKAQVIQQDFDDARKTVAALVQSLQVDGFELHLDTMTYTPVAPKVPPATDKPVDPPKDGRSGRGGGGLTRP